MNVVRTFNIGLIMQKIKYRILLSSVFLMSVVHLLPAAGGKEVDKGNHIKVERSCPFQMRAWLTEVINSKEVRICLEVRNVSEKTAVISEDFFPWRNTAFLDFYEVDGKTCDGIDPAVHYGLPLRVKMSPGDFATDSIHMDLVIREYPKYAEIGVRELDWKYRSKDVDIVCELSGKIDLTTKRDCVVSTQKLEDDPQHIKKIDCNRSR